MQRNTSSEKQRKNEKYASINAVYTALQQPRKFVRDKAHRRECIASETAKDIEKGLSQRLIFEGGRGGGSD